VSPRAQLSASPFSLSPPKRKTLIVLQSFAQTSPFSLSLVRGCPLLWIQDSRHCNFIVIERFVPISSLLWLNCFDTIFCYLPILPSPSRSLPFSKNPSLFPELRTEHRRSPLLWIQGSLHCNFIDIERFVPISSLLWLHCVDSWLIDIL